MTIATDVNTEPNRPLKSVETSAETCFPGISFETFLAQYGSEDRYELIDGELFDLEPSGAHEKVAAFLCRKLDAQIDRLNLPYFVLQRGILNPLGALMTGFRPDVMVVDDGALAQEPLWARQSILTLGSSVKFVAEVVSSNWQNDYSRKLEDYAALGIPEYWIVDYAGLGGVNYIGQPKQPTLSIATLVDGRYELQKCQGEMVLVSSTFPELNLTAQQLLEAGQPLGSSQR